MIYRDSKGRFCTKEHASSTTMKGYKGFHPGLVCLGKKYAENKVFIEKEAVPCKKGMHFCKNPIDILAFYAFINTSGIQSEFAEVEACGDIKTKDNIKFCTTKLKVKKKLSLNEFIKAALLFNRKYSPSKEESNGCIFIVSSRNYHSFVSNNGNGNSAATSGDCSIANAIGHYSVSIANGNTSIANSEGACNTSCTTGMNSLANSNGWRGISSTTNQYSIANSNGICSIASSTGTESLSICNGCNSIACTNSYRGKAHVTGEQSVAISTGRNGAVKGALGCWIACAEYNSNGDIVDVQMKKVDGKEIKADTWYRLENGKFVKVN